MHVAARHRFCYRLFIPQKPQDRKRLRAAASEAGEGGESSAGVGRTKVRSRANKNRPQEVSFTQCAKYGKMYQIFIICSRIVVTCSPLPSLCQAGDTRAFYCSTGGLEFFLYYYCMLFVFMMVPGMPQCVC